MLFVAPLRSAYFGCTVVIVAALFIFVLADEPQTKKKHSNMLRAGCAARLLRVFQWRKIISFLPLRSQDNPCPKPFPLSAISASLQLKSCTGIGVFGVRFFSI
jgi:hypothetical protein